MALLALAFCAGYALIALERPLRLPKAVTAVALAAALWTMLRLLGRAAGALAPKLSGIAGIVLYLFGEMAIVDVIEARGGFDFIADRIRVRKTRSLLWVYSLVAFFLSSFLDNLATAILMIALARRLAAPGNETRVFVAMAVIAANAGGAFSPIGDVTTTMLWLGGRITPLGVVRALFLPSLAALVVPLALLTFAVDGDRPLSAPSRARRGAGFLFAGLGLLALVPLFSALSALPPFVGILLALGLLWAANALSRREAEPDGRGRAGPGLSLRRIDYSTLLFFLGILLAVAALQVSGTLAALQSWLSSRVGGVGLVAFLMGLASAIVDNVPLVAATMSMYSLPAFPADHFLWELVALTVGTGGSLLVTGSAAGVAGMRAEGMTFGWYARRVSPPALAGFLAGSAVYLLERCG